MDGEHMYHIHWKMSLHLNMLGCLLCVTFQIEEAKTNFVVEKHLHVLDCVI